MRCSSPTLSALALLLSLASGCQESAWTPPSSSLAASLGGRPSSGRPGIIQGHLSLSGPPPLLPPLPTSPSVAAVCGPSVPDRSLVVGPDGALGYVVVALADGTEAPPPADPEVPSASLDQTRCTFEPPVSAARAGTALEVRNSDALLHNVDALAGSQRSILNVALPIQGSRVRRPLPVAPGVLQVRCDLHPWMSAAVRTFEHPWFTTTDASGHFRLEVPPGTHAVILWHPRLPGITRSISVRPGETVQFDYSWAAREVREAAQEPGARETRAGEGRP
ncbi:carboxypeptidase regulatory-like domain-containing protein [Archangium sp.]|uniref:carboxypeptidase regulatory-like domain-containing protein n=1 Tax=Archangium sp. TaxID=1872627 RepID=UPI00389AF727